MKIQICVQYGIFPQPATKDQRENQQPAEPYAESSPISEVETELFIGLPETRTRRISPPQV